MQAGSVAAEAECRSAGGRLSGQSQAGAPAEAALCVRVVDASKLIDDKGRFPNFISSGKKDGEFVLSSANNRNGGFVGLKMGLDDKGNLNGARRGTWWSSMVAGSTP